MTPWDDLLTTIDTLALTDQPMDVDTETRLVGLIERGQADRSIDRELRPDVTARWLVGLALAQRALRDRAVIDESVDSLDDATQLRMIATRWLHPARPGA